MNDEGGDEGRGQRRNRAAAQFRAWLKEVDRGFRNVGRHRPSPAMVVALIALAISMSTGAYAAVNIPRNSVGAAQLKNNAVTSKKLKKDAVVSSKIADRAIGSKEIAPRAVGGSKLADGAVGAGKISPGAVGSKEIKEAAVGAGQLASGSVTDGKIKEGAVGSKELKEAAVDAGKLASGSVTDGKIKEGVVGSKEIAEGAIDTKQVSPSAITAAKLAEGSVGVASLQPLPSARKEILSGTSQSVPNDPPIDTAKVIYGKKVFDTAGLVDELIPERLTVPVDGIFDFSANVNWAANPTGQRELSVRKFYSGGPGSVSAVGTIASQRIPAVSGGITPMNLSGTIDMRAGDYLWVYPWQDSGGPLDLITVGNTVSTFSLTFLSPKTG